MPCNPRGRGAADPPFCIISAAGVGVADHHGDGGAGGMAVDHTAQKLHHIRLGAGGGKPISAGAAAVHPLGDVRFIHRQPRGQAVQHSADGGTVAFAKMVRPNALPKVFSLAQSSFSLMPSRVGSSVMGILSARQQPRPGTLMTVMVLPALFLSCCI